MRPFCPVTRSWCLVILLVFTACSSKPVINEGEKDGENLRLIGRAYARVLSRDGQPPRDLAAILPFMQELGEPDTILVSPRDRQSYVIRWGTPLRRAEPKSPLPLIAYEKTGVDGKRLVLDASMSVHALDEDQFQQALKGS